MLKTIKSFCRENWTVGLMLCLMIGGGYCFYNWAGNDSAGKIIATIIGIIIGGIFGVAIEHEVKNKPMKWV